MFTVIASPPKEESTSTHTQFNHRHSVAAVARRRCRQSHHVVASELLGGVACGSCWETAIRADERIATECGLPAEATFDHSYIDHIAVERFLAGDSVRLTRAEKREVARALRAQGLQVSTIARRLKVSMQFVFNALPTKTVTEVAA